MRITLVSPALLLAALLASGVATHVAATAAGCSSRSAAILASLREGRFADATRNFDPTMRSGLPASKLQAVWAQALPAQVGALEDIGTPQAQTAEGKAVVETPLHFARATLLMRVACDKDGQVAGLFFAPAPAGEDHAAASPLPPGVHEQPLAVRSPLGSLPRSEERRVGKEC